MNECSLICQWVNTVGLEELLTTIILDSFKIHTLSRISALSDAEIQVVSTEFLQKLPALLNESVAKLKTNLELDQQILLCPKKIFSKFLVFPYNSGNIFDFHAGIAGHLGKSRLKMNFLQKN